MSYNQVGILLELVSLALLIWRDNISGSAVDAGTKSFLIERALKHSKLYNPIGCMRRKIADNFNWIMFSILIIDMGFQFFG
jgi:hypothetical protein